MPDSIIEAKLRSGLTLNQERDDMPPLCSLIQRRLTGAERLPDVVFDLLYNPRYRQVSDLFWSPVAAVRQAMAWLPTARSLKILDVGSGVGKFCIVGALASNHKMYGIERKPRMVDEARRITKLFPTASISFRCGNAFAYDWTKFDVLYFFNPFAELNFPELSPDVENNSPMNLATKSISFTLLRLSTLLPGALVLTYYTIGSPMPDGFERLKAQQFDQGYLELWLKL
ncbi:MAG: class I SAM-dependent methyltransferase [Bdellovibrionota bacterium]